jgi:N-acetyl-anhydromuramyl-L-alanine amidase AmpD
VTNLPFTPQVVPKAVVIGEQFTVPGLGIRYAADPTAQYGRHASANAEKFKGIVFHYTGLGTIDALVKYGHRVDAARGGSFGYHFYIDRDGTIVQGAPLSKRTNHIGQDNSLGLANENSVGISMVGTDENPTPAQLAAADVLAEALIGHFGMNRSNVMGHGEARGGNEGVTLAQRIRGKFQNATK